MGSHLPSDDSASFAGTSQQARPPKRPRKSGLLSYPHSVPASSNPSLPPTLSQRKRPADLVSSVADDDFEPPTIDEDFPMLRCGWANCRQGFWMLEDLLHHLVGEGGHVPPDPSAPRGQKCPCEWTGCPKQGKPQGSRMALLVHLRSHTGEKPFACHKPECDKTFSRTDALAKHVRVSHGETLPSFRHSNAKLFNNLTKRIKTEVESDQEEEIPLEGLETKEPELISQLANQDSNKADKDQGLVDLINPSGQLFDDRVDQDLRTEEERNGLDQLKGKFPSSDPTFLELVVMKAKIKFVLGERELLKAELKMLESKEASVQKEKDEYLDQILRKQLGEQSSTIWRCSIDALAPPEPPASNLSPTYMSPSSTQNDRTIKSSPGA